MIYESENGTYLFLFRSLTDEPCYADYWHETTEQAMAHATAYGVLAQHWRAIDDPLPGQQHDRL